MNRSQKKINLKIKTEPSISKSLPKLRLSSTKYVQNQQKQSYLIRETKKFPQKWTNSELILKKTMINLNVPKRISTMMPEQENCSPKKILPHPIQSRKSLLKLTGLKLQKQKVLNDDNLVHITAQKWLIYDCINGEPIKGFKYKKQHDIASLSKILTFYTAFMIIKQYQLSIDKIEFLVMKEDEDLGGTKIPMYQENIITLEDCLFAMLLNSANNAATVLANNLGFLCLRKRQNAYFSCFDINVSNRRKNIDFFVSLMHIFAQKLEMNDTKINNPHGMSGNISSARDIAKLFEKCWKIPLYQKILKTKQKPIEIKYVDSQGNLCSNEIILKTTNKMDNYNRFCQGGKTGENKNGGNSFVSYFESSISRKIYIIVVLGSFGRQQKFRDTDRLYEWVEHIEN